MNAVELISYLNENGVFPYVEDGKLKTRSASRNIDRAVIENIKSNKDLLIEFLSQDSQALVPNRVKIEKVSNGSGSYALSFAQQRLWFVDLLEGASPQYNLASAVRLEGSLNKAAMQYALDGIVERHEVLRTTFSDDEGEGLQVIQPMQPVNINQFDLTHLANQDSEITRLVEVEAAQPFDLSADLMLRCQLLKLADDQHVLLFTMHHIICDGWSMGLLIKEFSQLYQAYIEGNSEGLAPLEIQYADYAHWQRKQFSEQNKSKEIDFWRQRLSGMPQVHSLPLDKPRPKRQNYIAGCVTRQLSPAKVQALTKMGQQYDASLFMVLQSALALLIGRWSHETDVVIGSPVAGRMHKSLEPLIGFFVNNLVFRTNLSEQMSYGALLTQTKTDTLEAFSHQNIPFEMLVDELKPDRDLSYSPLFQIKFALQNNESSDLTLPGLTLSSVDASGDNIIHFDLDLTVSDSAEGMQLYWSYKHELFDKASIESLSQSFLVLLEAITADPEQNIGQISLQDSKEQPLEQMSQGPIASQGRALSLINQIEAQVAKSADSVALSMGDNHLTYQQLNQKANRLADYLTEQDIGVGSYVGICCERSLELMIGLLGVMKSGAAYIPIDILNTTDRLTHIIEDAGIELVLASAQAIEQLPVSGIDVLMLDDASQDQHWLDEYDEGFQSQVDKLDTSVYAIYTSGSTGKPKGVDISHQSLIDYCAFALNHYYRPHLSGAVVATSHSFDITVPCLYLPLMVGGCVDLLVEEDSMEGLASKLGAEHCDDQLLRMTPMHVKGFLTLMGKEVAPSTNQHVFVIGGEGFATEVAQDLQAQFPHSQIYNHYGPSEAVVGCCIFDHSANPQSSGAQLPIGLPMDNTSLYVLENHQQMVQLGMVGELYISGPCLAKGYLNQPQLTDEKFIPNPMVAGERMYQTGDLVRWLVDADGHPTYLSFVGRVDEQVKIRGYRIELGEIESQLRQHEAVESTVVIASGEADNKRLVAYVVAKTAKDDSFAGSLTQYLKQQLPEYMIPSAFVMLDAIPLSANGKVDKRALPEPGYQAQQAFVAPQTQTEIQLATIWQDVLGLDEISITANFFELGGHSLLATRVVSGVAQILEKKLQIRSLFDYPTIQSLAKQLDQHMITTRQHIPKVVRTGSLPLSFAQQRLWFVDHLDSNGSQYNMPIALKLIGQLNTQALQDALNGIVARHEVLRTTFIDVNGQGEQVVHEFSNVDIDYIDLRNEQNGQQKATQLAAEEAQKPFVLETDSVFRVTHITLSADENIILLTMHHIASDGWSMGILVKEFTRLYAASCQGLPNPLPPLAIQYADFAQWQRQLLKGEELERELAFWKRNLDGVVQVHSFPLDHPRPVQQTFEAGHFQHQIDRQTTAGLNALAKRHDASLFMVLQSVFALVVSRCSNETDIVIGSPIAGRLHQDVEPLIGFFINSLVLRTQLSPTLSFDQLLEQNKQNILEAYAHQNIPFEMLVDELKPERSLSHAPICQISFTFHNNAKDDLFLPGLKIETVENKFETIKLDFELHIGESDGQLQVSWMYQKCLFDESTFSSLSGHFNQLLKSIVADSSVNINELSMLSQAESTKFDQWATVNDGYPEDVCYHQLFEQQVQKTPSNIALDFEGEQLSYQQLNAQANQLARYLLDQGVEPDSLVGICAERSIEVVIGILAVMKAGGAYVPLDPHYPEDRLLHMLEDSGVEVVLTQYELLSALPFDGQTLIPIDENMRKMLVAELDDSNIPLSVSSVRSDHLVYVIYSSGSTGKSKGIEITHRNLVASTLARTEYYQQPLSQFLTTPSFSFDASIIGMCWALIEGATLNFFDEENTKRPDLIVDCIVQNKISHLVLVSSLYNAVLDQLAERLIEQPDLDVSSLKIVISGGDAMDPNLIGNHFGCKWGSHCELYNEYGPTETTIWSSVYRCNPEIKTKTIPIGRNPGHAQLMVLNQTRTSRQPIGVIGELFIGGPGVARGYHNRPELTAEQFIEHPFNPGQRIYATGDLVRWNANGDLEFIGRRDEQVKLRGFRIELGEIESILLQSEEVKEVLVLVKGEGSDKKLVAYIVVSLIDDEQEVDEYAQTRVLREQLMLSLPDYMIPAAFVYLPVFPLTHNGKIDKKALPQPVFASLTNYVAPTNEREVQMTQIWAQLLGSDKVGIYDNFFELGGDSILSIQMVSRASKLGIEITVKDLFTTQNIVDLLKVATTSGEKQRSEAIVEGEYTLLPVQQKFLSEEKHDLNHYNQSVLLKTPTAFTGAMLADIIDAIYARHDALRLRFVGQDDEWKAHHQPYSPQMQQQSCIVESLPNSPAEQDAFITERCDHHQAQFDLAVGPLLKAIYFRDPACGPDSSSAQERLFIVVHHIVVDGISWRILLADIEAAFNQLVNGTTIVLDQKTSSLAQCSQAQAAYGQSEVIEQEKAYWLQQYQLDIPDLKTDTGEVDFGLRSDQLSCPIQLTEQQTQRLLTKCAGAYNTQINELLLAGVYLGMHRWSANHGLRMVLEGHGREAVFDTLDMSETLGYFTSIYPFTFDCHSNDVRDVIIAMKEQYRQLPNHGVGYGVLKYMAKDPDIIGAAAEHLTYLEFNYLGQFDADLNEQSEFKAATEATGQGVGEKRARVHQLGINGRIFAGRLKFNLDYSKLQYHTSSMEQLAQLITQGLLEVIEHCSSRQGSCYTPADFALADVNQADLDQWQTQYPDITALYLATPMQLGLYFHTRMGSSAYHTQTFPQLRGPLDVDKFYAAWQRLVDRHHVFRTAFVGEKEKLHQLVCDNVKLPFHFEDWREYSSAEQQSRFDQYLSDDRNDPFDFTQAPLMRVALFQLDDEHHQLLWSTHHILADGWCSPLIYKEVVVGYQSLVEGISLDVADAPVYETYIAWLAAQDQDKALSYWSQKLSPFDSPTPLSIDKLPLDEQRGFQQQSLKLSNEETLALQQLAKNNQTTINTVLQLAWAYLLHRYSAEQTVMFGSTISGRPAQLQDIEQMMGLFINTIPVSVSFTEQLNVVDLLQNLQQEFQQGNEFGYLSLVDIQNQSNISGGTSMFDSLLVVENYPLQQALEASSSGSELTVEAVGAEQHTDYKLSLVVAVAQQLHVRCLYLGDDFAQSTISRLLGHLKQILCQLPAMAHQDINHIDILTTGEKDQLRQWNNTANHFPREHSLQNLFEAQVSLRPDAIALDDGSQTLSYGELNQRANRLARLLLTKGAGTDKAIGICIERSVETVLAMLAVIKAGGAYVPIDPAHPTERIEHILKDASIELLVCKSELASLLSDEQTQNHAIELIVIDEQTHQQQGDDSNLSEVSTSASDLAFIIFTSGSTGLPKGVALEHRGVVNLVRDNSYIELNSDSVVAQASNIAFDAATFEIWGALLNGARLVFIDKNTLLSPQLLSSKIKDSAITDMLLTTALFNTVARQCPDCFAPLKTMLFGGEQVSTQAVKAVLESGKPQRLVHAYGPSEGTTMSTWFEVKADHLERSTTIPIGAAVSNTRTYVIDKSGKLGAVGCIGELLLAGVGLARGYVNREALSAEKFVAIEGIDECRLYRTGDLARWLPDGQLEFVGRVDDQVKIRGFRIELGEIEVVLSAQPQVKDAIVIACGEGLDKRLAAYVMADTQDAQLADELRATLRRQLPAYMVPSAIIVVADFPLTANGKVDKRALPSPDAQFMAGHYTPANTATEKALTNIWSTLLKLSPQSIGIKTDFFDLGGHSLLMVRLQSHVKEQFSVSLELSSIYTEPSIEAMASLIDLTIMAQQAQQNIDDNDGEVEEQQW